MIQSKVDSRFLGTIQDTFHGLPPMPDEVRTFFMVLSAVVLVLLFAYWLRKYGVKKFLSVLLKKTPWGVDAEEGEGKPEKGSARVSRNAAPGNGVWKVTSDEDILNKLVMSRAQVDVLVERSGQRSLAAVVNAAGVESLDVVVTFKDLVSEDLLAPGAQVKCIFPEMMRDKKKVNAFVGQVKSKSEEKGMVITRRSSFGFIKRRVFARRKVADQRYIKVKIWRLEAEDYDVDYILDSSEPDVLIDNRKFKTPNPSAEQVLDISKGGIALTAVVREGGNAISRNDKVILCMLIYQPKRQTFQPHLIYAEVRAAKAMGRGMTRLSFQFLRSLKIPPRKRSSLFKGQAVMAMSLAHPEHEN
ncbi:hypothetical protein [Desulfovibrio sp. JC010]|uniref:hypothetical protein n=1 Tax=Desulfovibrio sp. JC010 TaxID=2593641 RepID=UPI0013D46AED|nr:hypothetical protein [Desulfovibrio sp. JC010]NDV25040.1 hypothetical protein [Desulfovibrio sp. JC010]